MIDLKQFNGHTPGPWEWRWTDYGGDNDGDVLYALPAGYDREGDEPGKTPLVTPAFREGIDLGIENARLIAAAPELLEELTRARVLCTERYDYKVFAECHKRCAEQAWRERDEANVEVERLRAALKTVRSQASHLVPTQAAPFYVIVDAALRGESDD